MARCDPSDCRYGVCCIAPLCAAGAAGCLCEPAEFPVELPAWMVTPEDKEADYFTPQDHGC